MNKSLDNIIHKLIYTCEEASLLIEKKASTQSLRKLENFRLKIHLAMCKFCRAYQKKVNSIDQAINRISKKSDDTIKDSEIKDFTKHLKQSL